VERVARGTAAPDQRWAAAVLIEGLMHPGFDPNVGAAASRRGVARKATIAVLNHRKTWRRYLDEFHSYEVAASDPELNSDGISAGDDVVAPDAVADARQ
jgi:hypothetical protein